MNNREQASEQMKKDSRQIVGVVYPGAVSLDLLGPMEAFNYARLEVEGRQPDAYVINLAAMEAGVVGTMSGIRLVADKKLDDLEVIDTLLIPGALSYTDMSVHRALVQWLKDNAGRIRRVASICSGALICAEAGLLEGKRVTTHWMDTEELRTTYPGVKVEPDQIFVKDPPIYSSGGITAGIDLALALIEEDFDRQVALNVARRMVVFLKRQGGQKQFSDMLRAQTQAKRFAGLIEWIEQNLNLDLNVDVLAEKVAMSPRNFSRRFSEELNTSPMKFVEARRLDKTKQLLEETHLGINTIATQAGFESGERFRKAFKRRFGATPSAYRNRFGLISENIK